MLVNRKLNINKYKHKLNINENENFENSHIFRSYAADDEKIAKFIYVENPQKNKKIFEKD